MFAAIAAALVSFSSCKKDNGQTDDKSGKTEITVAKDALIAHFNFEGNAEDQVAGLKPKQEKAEYTAKRNGKALKGIAGGVLLYDVPADSKLKSATSITIAMWLKQAPIPTSQAPVPCFFEFVAPDAFWGNFAMSIDRKGDEENPSDLLTPKVFGQCIEGRDFWKTDGDAKLGVTGNRWNHIIYTYDAAKSEFHVYLIGADVTPEDQIACTFGVVEEAVPDGNLDLTTTTQFIIGAWQNKVIGGATDEWMGDFLGEMDELRIYDKALTKDEAKTLYQGEVANLDE